jgi:hypothetical protein
VIEQRDGSTSVVILRSTGELAAIRDFWTSCPAHRDGQIDLYHFIVDSYPEVVCPHVIAVYRDGAPVATLLGRLEQRVVGAGFAISRSPPHRCVCCAFSMAAGWARSRPRSIASLSTACWPRCAAVRPMRRCFNIPASTRRSINWPARGHAGGAATISPQCSFTAGEACPPARGASWRGSRRTSGTTRSGAARNWPAISPARCGSTISMMRRRSIAWGAMPSWLRAILSARARRRLPGRCRHTAPPPARGEPRIAARRDSLCRRSPLLVLDHRLSRRRSLQ